MRDIRIITETDIDDYLTIFANAYPGFDVFSEERRKNTGERVLAMGNDPACHIYALFEDGQMRGNMRLYDFNMTLLSTQTSIGGVGAIAVDLLHKKEKVAADMLRFFHKFYKDRGACMTALYPFRPDFYKQMGYGYGTPMNSYYITPASLPQGPTKAAVHFLDKSEREQLESYRSRYVAQHNGMLERLSFFWDWSLRDPAVHIAAVKRHGQISGYLMYKFLKRSSENLLDNDILVRELVYDTAEDLRELLTFLHIQKDQINRIVINSQDETFFFLFKDPRNDSGVFLPDVIYHQCYQGGVGIMYRVVDVTRLFQALQDHDFNGISCRLKINITDTFFPENAGETTVHFQNGRAKLAPGAAYDVQIDLDVSEFSSLIMGAINFARLHNYGLVSTSDVSYVPALDRLFAAPKPVCQTSF